MRLRWLLLAVVTMSLMPSLASARSRPRGFDRTHEVAKPATPADYSIGAAINEETLQLVIAFYNPNKFPIELPVRVVHDKIDYDWLTVEISNETTSRKISFVSDREESVMQTARIEPNSFHFETIELGPEVHVLPAGTYDVRVTWDGQVTATQLTSKYEPLRCGLAYRYDLPEAPPAPAPPSKWPYVLGVLSIIALLVQTVLGKRAGTASGRVPCSAL